MESAIDLLPKNKKPTKIDPIKYKELKAQVSFDNFDRNPALAISLLRNHINDEGVFNKAVHLHDEKILTFSQEHPGYMEPKTEDNIEYFCVGAKDISQDILPYR